MHGAPISGTVDVYRLAAPAVVPAVAPGDEQEPSPERPGAPRGRIWRGALVGGVIGCPIGNYLSRKNNDDAHFFNCLWVAGVGAAFGAIYGSVFQHGATNSGEDDTDVNQQDPDARRARGGAGVYLRRRGRGQERQIKGIVVQTPTGLNTTGHPVANARVEYMGDNLTEVQTTTTDANNGRFELPSGTGGIVTASKSGLTTLSVGYIDSPNSTTSTELRIELPRPATLSGRLYMATRRNAGNGMVVVDHEVNPRSAAASVTNGQYKFDGLLTPKASRRLSRP